MPSVYLHVIFCPNLSPDVLIYEVEASRFRRIPLTRIRWTRQNLIGIIYLLFFVAIMGYGLFHRGLFFRPEQTYVSTAVIIIGLIGLIVLTVMKKFRIPSWLLAMIAYVGYALLSTLWAANAELAVGGAVTTAAGVTFAAFIPMLSLTWRNVLLSAISIGGVVLYLFSMANVFGLFHYENAIQNNMMDSVFQYHNTFGSFVLAGALIALVLGLNARKHITQALYYLVASINLVGVFASYSRWVWILTFVMLATLFGISFAMKQRLRAVLITVLIPLVSAVAGALTIAAIHKTSISDFVLSMAVAFFGIAIVTYLMRLSLAISNRKRRIVLSLTLAILPVVIGLVIVFLDAKHFGSILSRLESIRFQSSSLQGRFWFYGAALHMWEHNPIFGSSSGTWTAKFQAYQQFPYWSTMTHSVFFSQLTDFGLVGTLLWFQFIGLVVVQSIRTLRKKSDWSPVQLAALLAATSLLIHALMDFDMDFPTITFVFFVLLGMAAPVRETNLHTNSQSYRYGFKVSMFSGMALLSVLGVTLSLSQVALQAADKAKNVDSKTNLLKRAEVYAPYVATPHSELAALSFNNYSSSHAGTDRDLAWTEAQYAVKRAPWDPSIQQQMATVAYQLGHLPEAYHWSQKATQDGPFNVTYPSSFMGIGLWSGVEEYAQNPSDAQKVFQSVIDTYNRTAGNQANLKSLPPDVTAQWLPNIQAYQVSAPMQVYAATAEYCLGNYQKSIDDMHFLAKMGQDYNTLGLYEMVALLDEAHLGQGSVANVPNEMQYKNSILTQEYQVLSKIGK